MNPAAPRLGSVVAAIRRSPTDFIRAMPKAMKWNQPKALIGRDYMSALVAVASSGRTRWKSLAAIQIPNSWFNGGGCRFRQSRTSAVKSLQSVGSVSG